MRHMKQYDLWTESGSAALGCFADCNQFIFKRDDDGTGFSFGWHVGCANFSTTAIIAWPMSLLSVPGHENVMYIDWASTAAPPVMIPILTWRNLRAIAFEWRSPAWLLAHCGRSPAKWRQAVRAVTSGAESEPLEVVAAKQGWWNLGVSDLKMVAAHLGVDMADKPTLAKALVTLTQQVLDIDEEAAMALLVGRLVKMREDAPMVDELLEVDEASKLLTREDED